MQKNSYNLSMEFTVRTADFEGPLDLLLDLIEKRKLHISDISLSSVTDDFIKYVNEMDKYSMGSVAHFILVASTLLLIKSKSLLPTLSLSEEEEADIKDLEARLRLLQRIRGLGGNIKERFGKKIIFAKSEQRIFEPVFSPDPTVSREGLAEAIRRVILAIPIKEMVPRAVVKKIISIEEMIEQLIKRVEGSLKTSFRDFAKSAGKEKISVIVGFLAMLELVKQGVVAVAQHEHFGDIEIETAKIGLPRIV